MKKFPSMETEEKLYKSSTRRAKLPRHWLVLRIWLHIAGYNNNVFVHPFMRRIKSFYEGWGIQPSPKVPFFLYSAKGITLFDLLNA